MATSPISFSPFVIGTMRLGAWGAQMNTTQLEAFVEGCLDLGLNDFDHADIYGHYTTEAEFGKLLKQRPDLRQKIQLTTKSGIKLVSDNRPDHHIKSYDSSKEHIIASAEKSLNYLSTDHIDLLLIHRPDYLMDPHEIAEAFDQLRSSGKVLHFGVSNFTPAQFELLHSFTPLVNNQIEASIMHLNPFEDGTLLQCQKHGIKATAWSPLGGGTIFQESDDPKILRIQSAGKAMAKKHGVQLDQLLMAWLLKHPAGIIPVLGTSKLERVKDTMKALDIQLSREEWYTLWKASTGEEIA